MKKYLYFAAATLALASCSSDDFLGDKSLVEGNGAIYFKLQTPNLTRGSLTDKAAATTLNNQFIVWGEKNEATDGSAASNANMVLKNYTVNWKDNTAGTTTSNSANWEYVGQTAYESTKVSPSIGSTDQTIKYWDFGATSYTFTAVSAMPSDISGELVKIEKTTSASSVYNKGYTITVKSGATVGDIYYADRWNAAPNSSAKEVTLTFRNFQSKINFAMYETIPGYKVKVTKVYYGSENSTEHFAVAGSFVTTGSDAKYIVTYNDEESGNENKVKVALDGTTKGGSQSYMTTTSNTIMTADPLATSASAPTTETAVAILPNPNNASGITVKVDYTLTSEDTGETINVKEATATVPAAYCQWQSNYLYTYIFKISDNTNGQTGSVAGLYPITLDAVVETETTTGEQKTITTVAEKPITTYAMRGTSPVTSDLYKGNDDIYATVQDGSATVAPQKLYKVSIGTGAAQEISEASVENAIANGIYYVVSVTAGTTLDDTYYTKSGTTFTACSSSQTAVDGTTYYKKNSDGTYTVTDANSVTMTVTSVGSENYETVTSVPTSSSTSIAVNALHWTAQKNVIYAVEYTSGDSKYYKVVTILDSGEDAEFLKANAYEITTSGSATITYLKNGAAPSAAVGTATITPSTGATCTESASAPFGVYTFKATAAGTYTVKVGSNKSVKIKVTAAGGAKRN